MIASSPIDRIARADETAAKLTLEEAYTRARSRSSELRTIEERIIEAEINVGRAWTLLKPMWNASFAYTHTEPRPPAFEIPALPNFNNPLIIDNCVAEPSQQQAIDCVRGITEAIGDAGRSPPTRFDFARDDTVIFDTRLTWNIFNGRAIPLIKNAYDAVSIERERSTATVLDLLLTVARAYYTALATEQSIAAAERARIHAGEELAIVKQKSELGETVRSQLVAAEIAARQASTDVRRAENAHRQALAAIAFLTRSEEPFAIVAPAEAPLRPEGDVAALKAKARVAREDLRAAELAIVVAERFEQEAWWKFAPTLAVFGDYRWSNVAGISGQKEQWSVGLVATAPLYDGGLRYQDLRAAESRLRAANEGLESVRARVDSEVDRAVLRLDAAAMAIERAEDAVLLAKERRELTARQYEVGALRSIELKEANDAVLNAEIAMIRARMDEAIAILELQRAVGLYSP